MNRQSAGKTFEIIETYKQSGSILDAAKNNNVTYEQARITLRKNGFVSNKKKPIKSNTLDKQYFYSIDREDKAYFLGLLKADGYLDKSRNRLALRLNIDDQEILKRFCDSVKLPIERINILKSTHSDKYFSANRKDSAEVAITNEEFVRPIMELKTNEILKLIPKELSYHFIRGYFDGDGCISYKNIKKGIFQLTIMGSPNDAHMLNYIKEYFNINIYYDKRSNLPYLKSDKQNLILEFREKCYKDCYVYLARKKAKFDLVKFSKETSTTTRETPKIGDDIV